jgi:hypothetical protein
MNPPSSHHRHTDAQEHRLAQAITDALDARAEQLPYRVSLRLEQARHAALSRAPAEPVDALAPAHPFHALSGSAAGGNPNGSTGSGRPALWWRICSAGLPFLIVACGLVGIALWHDADDLLDTAEVDAGLVLNDDDIPVSALADRGFSVFLRNTRQ